MTKKFICPNCKTELGYVIENARENVLYTWTLDANDSEYISDQELGGDSETIEFYCPDCRYSKQSLNAFIVEKEEVNR